MYSFTFSALSTSAAFPFAGVNVDATGNEKILYSITSFCVLSSSSITGVSFTLKASEIVGVYGFTMFTTSEPIFSSFTCPKVNCVANAKTPMIIYFVFFIFNFIGEILRQAQNDNLINNLFSN